MTISENANNSARKAEIRIGDKVLIRVFGGDVVPRRVWEVDGSSVAICSELCFERLQAGQEAAMPIMFPMSDIVKVLR